MKKDYFALWSILAVAFVLFLTLSMCDDIHIDFHLKSSGMADALSHRESEPPDTSALVAQGIESVDADTLANDTTPKTVLFIGDSMVECLGPRMSAYCNAYGHRLFNVVWYSSTTELYGTSHLLADYIEVIKPDFIFLSLGGNELFIKNIIEKRDKYVKTILSEIGDIPYIWIGPPNWKPDTGINELLANNVKDGCLFVSNGIKMKRKKDGAHPNAASSIEWMDSIARWIPLNARYKLPLGEPEKSTAKPAKLILHQPGELKTRPKPSDADVPFPTKDTDKADDKAADKAADKTVDKAKAPAMSSAKSASDSLTSAAEKNVNPRQVPKAKKKKKKRSKKRR